MATPIDMMREFCTRHNLGEDAMEELQKIVDASIICISRGFIAQAKPAKKAKKQQAENAEEKHEEAKPAKVRCEGTKKNGEACKSYALKGKTCCRLHAEKPVESGTESATEVAKPVKEKAAKVRCEGQTKKGEPCKAYALKGKTCCRRHAEEEEVVSESETSETSEYEAKEGSSSEPEKEIKEEIEEIEDTQENRKMRELVQDFFKCNPNALDNSQIKLRDVRNFLAGKGMEVTDKKALKNILTSEINIMSA